MKWILASDRLPAMTHKQDKPVDLIICRKLYPEGYKRVHSMTANQIADYIKHDGIAIEGWRFAELDWEWLDESPSPLTPESESVAMLQAFQIASEGQHLNAEYWYKNVYLKT